MLHSPRHCTVFIINDTIALHYTKFNRLLTFHLHSVSFPCRKMVIVRMVKENGWKQYKRIKTSRMSEGTKKRRTERAGALAKRFSNKRSVEKCVWQDEKDFTLEVPLNHQNSRAYGKNRKGDISDDRLFHNTNRQSKKVMVSACIRWYGATKSFFVNNKGLKVNAKR